MTEPFLLFDRLTSWYTKNKRPLPWRNTSDPYIIWIAEVIFQQTRIDQGLPYFQRFVDKFPDVISLANAKDDEVYKLWQGLGYYSRARNLLEAARYITFELKGIFPDTLPEINKLKGVGTYTSAAIASIAFKIPVPAIDGNVKRVVSRLFAIDMDIQSTSFIREISPILEENIKYTNPSDFNQGLMELGALVCTPRSPKCHICPVSEMCQAMINNKQDFFPINLKKQQKKELFLNFLFIKKDDSFFIRKRVHEKIWNKLYELPCIESKEETNTGEFILLPEIIRLFPTINEKQIKLVCEKKHQLTHKNINAKFWHVPLPENIPDDWILFNPRNEELPGVHKLVEAFLDEMLDIR